jgi:hypothetical protein
VTNVRLWGMVIHKRVYTATAEAKTLFIRSCILQLRGHVGGFKEGLGGFIPAWAHTILKEFLSFCEYLDIYSEHLKVFPSMYYPMYYPCLPMYSMYYPSNVLSFPCIILSFPCITLAPFDVFTCVILAFHDSDLENKVTYTTTIKQKRLRSFSCCPMLTLFRVTLFNLRLFITIPQ